MTYKIISQQTPYKFTTPIVLIIDADNKENAFIEAYKQLTKNGFNVVTDNLKCTELNYLNQTYITEKLGPEYTTNQMVFIRNIQEFN